MSVSNQVKTQEPDVSQTATTVRGSGERGKATRQRYRPVAVGLTRFAILVAALAAWQFLPTIGFLRKTSHIFDPYFVSSPIQVVQSIIGLFTGINGSVLVWPYLWPTVVASLVGTILGIVVGALLGLILSNWQFVSAVARPFIVAANATPRIALVPVIVLIFGPTIKSSVIIAFMVVVFVAFFSAYEGGVTVAPHLVQNARLLGASEWSIVRHVRAPYVAAWTISSLPLSVTLAIITVVTGEILTGTTGMGVLLQTADTAGNSALTFSVAVILAVVGLLVVVAADGLRSKVLHWWGK